MVKEYRGPFELKGNVLRTSVETLFGASNTGDQLGEITVRDLAYQPEDRGTSQIELPEAVFSVISLGASSFRNRAFTSRVRIGTENMNTVIPSMFQEACKA